ncbi:MAG: hypothetical protein A2X11_05090 [Bacteroidetes bacterium GWE2_42_24]|nr:MAG: hypothetical protein A2X11_05090 [Bacteroidetes bacterium GWE2_42_24]OFY26617.1 MAG: hypothetical protein A2X09_03480 [Bacteroidetes bacterium GWF2_43_11]
MANQDIVRDSIVQSARDLFSRFGFRKTTMDDIALSMRKGKSSIYYYFKSKEDIFEAVVDSEASELKSRLKEVLRKNTDDPKEQLRQYIAERLKLVQQLANFYNALRSDYLSHLEFITHVRERYSNEEIHTLEVILKVGIRKGVYQINDPRIASVAIVTAMQGMENPIFLGKLQDLEIGIRLDAILDIIFHGITTRNDH